VTGEAPPGSGPTVRRILLGSQLRRLREAREITRDQAGYAIRASESKISRMELGRVPFKERDVADLLTLYQVTDEAERAPLLALANAANVPGWWHRYGDVLADWFQPYLGLEEAASMVRTYEVQFVPGLLQTPEYARAVITAGIRGADDAEAERRVARRTEGIHRLAEPTALSAKGGRHDINAVGYEQLRELGLSVAESARLLAVRDVRGGFRSLDELDDVQDFPAERLTELKSRLRV